MNGGHLIFIRSRKSWARFQSVLSVVVPTLALATVSHRLRAETVVNWGLDTTLSAATLTEGVPGSFSVTTPTGNAGPRALLATPLSLANIGDTVRLSGNTTLQNTLGNQQFRLGLYNTNGRAAGTLSGGVWSGADPVGWLGYMFQVGGSAGTDAVRARTGAGTSAWLANGDTYIVGSTATTVTAPAATPYAWSLTLARTAPMSVKADYTFVGGTINRSGSYIDANLGASAAMASINAVGFLLNANTGSAQFSNVTVEVPKSLRLRVNVTTGFVSIANKEAGLTFSPSYYEIASAAGTLTPASWLSLDGDVPASPTSWEKAGGSSAMILSETNLNGSLAFPPQGPSAALGKAFSPSGAQDLAFRYGLADGTLQSGTVEYVTGGPAGDFDVDGDVDGRDFLVWQRGVGPAFSASNLTDWRNTFGTVAAAASTGAVPEPASALLLTLAALACGHNVRGRLLRRRIEL